MARPRVISKLDADQIEYLASIGCTDEEIAHVAGLNERTLQKRFGARLKVGRANLKVNLRKLQWRAAERGNTGMIIWLSKQYLHQYDLVDIVRILDAQNKQMLPAPPALVVDLTERLTDYGHQRSIDESTNAAIADAGDNHD